MTASRPHRPSRSGADLAALLGYGPRQALGSSQALRQPRESLGDVLSRSIPSTLQEVLAHSLGVDPHEQQQPEEPEPEVDTAEPEPDTSTAFKLPPLPELPPLAESLAVFEQWRGTGDADHE